MGVHIEDNKLVIFKKKTFHVDLTKDDDNNLMHEIDFIRKHNEFFAEYRTKNKN